ncbi:MAG TPA: DUF5916 domain-containing protein, partial [Acidobacteriota bacterium]|nr:DUF5916 domain-containing protein [Acidobacteriota bacterium]
MANTKPKRYIYVKYPEFKVIMTGMFKENIARVVFVLTDQINSYKTENIPAGLRFLLGKKDMKRELSEEELLAENQKESQSSDLRKKQPEKISRTTKRIDIEQEEIKDIYEESLNFKGRFREPSFHQDVQSTDRQKQISSLDQSFSEEREIQATVLDLDSIEVDGNLDELAWGEASVLQYFTQHEPIEGAPATKKTEAKIFFGRDSVYIGVRAFDSNPEQIKSILARRDSKCPSDWIIVYIDSYHDHMTAFEFGVNPSGVKRDAFWSNDQDTDDDWDAVWDVGVSQDELGWIAEFGIPYSQIRYTKKKVYTWGFQVSRVVSKNNETSYWRHIPKGVPRFVSLFGDIKGIKGIPAPKRIQILPYALGKISLQSQEEGNPLQTGPYYLTNGGLDLKYGVSSNLTLDAALNPDFGQVEADPAKVNLTAYETYFSEKRPFFIEGKNMMSFSIGGISSRESLFYSRRIGRVPQGSSSNSLYKQEPENTTILGALKLTGKTAQGWSIGILESLTGKEKATLIFDNNERGEEAIEPLSNYFLGRARKEFRDGRSTVGMIFTAVNRKIDEETLNFLHKAAYTGGIDFRHRWLNDTYEVSGELAGSHVLGSKEAILETQEAPAHYFQRPHAPHLNYDPDRTSLSGYSMCFNLKKIGGRHWRWSLHGMARSPGFETNDIGYLRYADWINQSVSVSYWEFKPGKIFRDYHVSLSFSNDWDFSLTHLDHREHLSGNFQFINYWNFNFNLSRESEHLKIDYLRGGPAIVTPITWRYGGSFSTDKRKYFFLQLNGNVTSSKDGSNSYVLSSNFTVRLFSNLSLSFSPHFSDVYQRLHYVTQIRSKSQNHYILSRIDQKIFYFTLRVNYTLTPNLSLQLYTQPFISAGDYSEFKEVIQPQAKNYSDRWYIFNDQELSLRNNKYYLFLPWTEGKEI